MVLVAMALLFFPWEKKRGVRILFSEEKMMKKESKLNKVMVYVYIVRNNARKRMPDENRLLLGTVVVPEKSRGR